MWISYQLKPEYDFGRLRKDYVFGKVPVSKKEWEEYCRKRFEFDLLHSKLVDKISNRKRYSRREQRKWLQKLVLKATEQLPRDEKYLFKKAILEQT